MSLKTLFPYFISIALLIVVLLINRNSFKKMEEFTYKVDNTRSILNGLERISNHLKSAELYSPGYKNASGNYYQLYQNEMDSIPGELAKLQVDVADHPLLPGRVKLIDQEIKIQLKILREKNIVEIIQSGEAFRLDALYKIHKDIRQLSDREVQSLNASRIQLTEYMNENKQYSNLFFALALSVTIAAFLYNLVLVRKSKWLEGFLESILNTSHNGIIHYAAVRSQGQLTGYRIEFANAAAEQLLGAKSSKLIGKNVHKHTGAFENEPLVANAFKNVVESGKPLEFELHYTQNGKDEWFNLMLAKMEDGLTATVQKITNVKHYQEELKRNIRKLEISNGELEQYAYITSHDLQEPLRKIRTYSSFLAAQQGAHLDEKGRMHLAKITHSAERMTNLINDILDFSSLRHESSFVPTDLNTILQNVLNDLELSIKQKRASIHATTLPKIPAVPQQINQLFHNLISNALKFSNPQQCPEITITSTTLTNEEVLKNKNLNPKVGYCCVRIKDNGIGFNQEFSAQVFGLFKRLHDSQVYPGSGIGLAICSKVVANHNGDIYVHSEEKKGATFYVILPLT